MIDKDVNVDECRKEESEMTTTLAAVKIAAIVLAISGVAVSVLAASAPTTAPLNAGLTCLILAGVCLVLWVLARWIRAVLRDNRATRRAVRASHNEMADLVVQVQQELQRAIKKNGEELSRKADELTEAFVRVAEAAEKAPNELDQKRRLISTQNMTRHI